MNAPLLRDRLPVIAPERAERQSGLIGALNRRRLDALTTEAGLAPADEQASAGAWIGLEAPDGTRLQLAPLLAAGTIPQLFAADGGPDAAAAAVALAEVEPLVAALERVLGVALAPVSLDAQPAAIGVGGAGTIIRFDALQDRVLVHRVLVAVPDGLPLRLLAPLPLAAGPDLGLRLAWTAGLAGPTLPASSAARLARGDLLLLGPGPMLARLALPGRGRPLLARLDMLGGFVTVEQELVGDASGPGAGGPTPPLPANDFAAATVATRVEIEGAGLTVEQVATLGIGSVVPVMGAAGGTLAVRVVAGDQPVATGELIVVGDGFGVLVTALAPAQNGER